MAAGIPKTGWLLQLDNLRHEALPDYGSWIERIYKTLKGLQGGQLPLEDTAALFELKERWRKDPLNTVIKDLIESQDRTRQALHQLDNRLSWMLPGGETAAQYGVRTKALAADPAQAIPEQEYWNTASDVLKYNHVGAWKRVGTPGPIWKQYVGANLTFAIPTAGWVEVSTDLRITITPAQKVVVVAECQFSSVSSDIAARPGIDITITPAPADVKYFVSYGGASGSNIQIHAVTIATLTANTAHTITPKVNQGGGPGTITIFGASGETLSWATFHHPA